MESHWKDMDLFFYQGQGGNPVKTLLGRGKYTSNEGLTQCLCNCTVSTNCSFRYKTMTHNVQTMITVKSRADVWSVNARKAHFDNVSVSLRFVEV